MELLPLITLLDILVLLVIAMYVGLRLSTTFRQRRNQAQPKEVAPSKGQEQVTIPDPETEKPASKHCPACEGMGFCTRCDGHGRYSVAGRFTLVECATCESSGNCRVCAGTGRLNGTATTPSA